MEKEIFFGDIYTHRREKTKVIIELGKEESRGFGACTLLEDGSLMAIETDTVDDIIEVIGRMTLAQLYSAAQKGMEKMGDDGLTENQIALLQREAVRDSRVIHY